MDKVTYRSSELENILGNEYVSPSEFVGNEEEYTAFIMSRLADSVCEMIKFTYDTPSMNEGGKMPILDVKVKMSSENVVIHDFYEKPTKNQRVILASSALGWPQKRSIHTQEILRRFKNTSPILGEQVQNYHASMYLLRMKNCGYDKKFRSEVLKSAKSAYEKIFEKHKKENTPLYKNRHELDKMKFLKHQSPQN